MDNQEIRHPDGRIEHPFVKLETKDVRLAGVVATVIGVAMVFGAVDFAARSLFRIQQRRETGRVAVPGSHRAGDILPRQPRLEPFEPQLPAQESFAAAVGDRESELHGYGATEDSRFARVPIEIAIQHTARQLQGKSERKANKREPVVSGDANSGRVFREGEP
jgi:hypothetical protein